LLFTNPIGARFPLVTNLFGSPQRAELAFGKRPMRLVKDWWSGGELSTSSPEDLGRQGSGFGADEGGTRRRRSAAVMDVCTTDSDWTSSRVDLLARRWGPFSDLPLVLTYDPDGRGHNLGMYRMQIFGRSTTGMHWQIGKGGGFHFALAESRGEALPVSVFLGGPPALILAAIAPLPENVPELLLASLIAGERSEWPTARTRLLWRTPSLPSSGRSSLERGRGKARSGTTTATTHSGTTTRFRDPLDRPPKGRHLSGDSGGKPRQEDSSSEICCRNSSRRSYRWSCLR